MVEEEHARTVKRLSFELHNSLKELVDGASSDSVLVPLDELKRFQSKSREINCETLRYARAVVKRVDRMEVDNALMKTSFFEDLLDREATHTKSLEQIGLLEVSVDGNTSASVERALKIAKALNATTSVLTAESTAPVFDSQKCAKTVAGA